MDVEAEVIGATPPVSQSLAYQIQSVANDRPVFLRTRWLFFVRV